MVRTAWCNCEGTGWSRIGQARPHESSSRRRPWIGGGL
uniref:Uncharacterized protein n=1 Tax=Setaria italica TaxID=4555 RepID=K4A437_SETIT